jgi:hypothetical protein
MYVKKYYLSKKMPMEIRNNSFTHSEAVYGARALLASVYPDSTFISPCEEGFNPGYRSMVQANGANAIEYPGLLIYPNPANQTLFIGSINEAELGLSLVEIFDVSGVLVLREQCNIPSRKGIDISELPNGLYFVSIIVQESLCFYHEKFIKIKY